MMSADELFGASHLMAILRDFSPAEAVSLAHTAWDVGIELVEVPIQTADAVPALSAVLAAGRDRGKPVGVGTVVRADQVSLAKSLGAAFTVAPGLDIEVARASLAAGMPHLPGV